MMAPIGHFLFGMFCGAAIGAVGVVFRRRWALYLPLFVLACGFWADAPEWVGAGATRHGLANVFFGYVWLHPWAEGQGGAGLLPVVAIANVLLLGYVVFLTGCFWTMDTVRWEREGWEGERKRSGKSRSKRHKHRRMSSEE